MAVKSVEILEQLTQGILGAKNFDSNIPKWEVENYDLPRTFFSDRQRNFAQAPFNKKAIERMCSLYRSQFGIYKMREPISNESSCNYANAVLDYLENLTSMNLDLLRNVSSEPEKSFDKRAYILEILQHVLMSIEDKEYFELSESLKKNINGTMDRFNRRAGTSGFLTESQQRNFLVEAKGKCVRCDTKVIMDQDAGVVESYEFLFLEKRERTDRKNVIVLCKNCYELLKNGISDAEKNHLVRKKHMLEIDMKYQEELDEIKLEEEIEEIIQQLTSVKSNALVPLNYEPKEVLEKIPDDFLLSDSVTRNVVKFFKYIQSLLKNIGTEKKYKDNFISDEIKRLYLSIADSPGSQQEKFDQMVNWLMQNIGNSNRKACEIVISYYIQDCEVFGEK